jgi:predicted RNA binding protein YcfA (HicA-like mRNA interferase family)
VHILGLTLKPQEMINFLKYKGYRFVRSKGGSHHMYSNGKNSIPIPIHGSKDFGEDFIRIVLREAGISKNDLLAYLKR